MSGYTIDEICTLEEAKNLLNFGGGVIIVEGQVVHSYEELVGIVTQEKYKEREIIDINLVVPYSGG